MKNTKTISERFREGRSLLDSGYYQKAIEVFTDIIDEVYPFIDHEGSKLTWDTSLNNRGVAKCKLGYSSGDKSLYQSGLEDFRTTVQTISDEELRSRLTANRNLIYGEEELKDFDNQKGVRFGYTDLSE